MIKKRKFKSVFQRKETAVIAIIAVAAIGTYLIVTSHAATPYASIAATSGSLTSGATVQSDSNALNGQDVHFGSSTSADLPTPTSLDSTYTKVVFDDEFTGTSLSTSKWETCVFYTSCHTAEDIGDDNGGTEDPANVSVDNGLTLDATSSTPANAQSWGDGWIDSAPYYETPSGGNYYVEIKAKLSPAAPGLWPALVLYEDNDIGASKPYAEMDILERISQPQSNGTVDPPTAFQSWHPASGASTSNEIDGSAGNNIDLTGWNTYGVSVSSSGSIQYWFNGNPTGSAIQGGSNALEGMFLSLSETTGGTPDNGFAGVTTAATPSPSYTDVDYTRVFTP